MTWRFLAILSALLFSCWEPAFAQIVPGESNWQFARFPAGATTVVVDVIEAGGSQLVDNVAATNVVLDAVATDQWQLDVSTVTGYPATCDRKTYSLRWQPDAINCATSPELCVESDFTIGGANCRLDPRQQVSETFARSPVTEQGISRGIIKAYNRIGQEPLRWRRIDVAADLDFSTPSSTRWEVAFYTNQGQFGHRLCLVTVESDPAVSLPTAPTDDDCDGN